MANVFDQFDTPGSGNVFDQFDQAPEQTQAVRPGDVEGAKKLLGVEGDAATGFRNVPGTEPANVARERQTFTGEVGGGLSQFLEGMEKVLGDPSKLAAPLQTAGNILRGKGSLSEILEMPQTQMLAGGVRAAAPVVSLGTSPALFNAATATGEAASDALSKRGFTTAADVVGGGVAAAADVLGGMGTAKLASRAINPVRKALPIQSEKMAALNKEQEAAEALINREAEAARRQAEAARSSINANTQSALSSEESIGMAAKEHARQQAQQARATLPSAEKARALTSTKHTSEDIGRTVQERIYAPKREASTARFNKEYGEIEAAGSQVKGDASEYKAAADRIYGKPEAGISRPLQSKAETAAGGAKRALEIEDEHYQDLVARAEHAKRQGLNNADILEEEVKRRRVEFEGKQPTVTELIHERQRLRAAERAAYDTGNDKLGHQFKELQEAIGRDIGKLDEGISGRLAATDAAYASEHIPFFGPKSEIRKAMESGPEAVIDRLVPKATDVDRVAKVERLTKLVSDKTSQKALGDGFIKNMVGDASKRGEEAFGPRIQSVWAKYADDRSGDKVLKTVLGDRYEPMKAIVEQTRKVKPQSINKTLETALKKIDENTTSRTEVFTKERMNKLKTLEGALGEGEKVIGDVRVAGKAGSIEKQRLERLATLKDEFKKKAEKIGIHEIPEHGGQLVGTAMILHGGVGGVAGAILGAGVTGAVALSQVLTGAIVLMAAPALMKLTNTARGAEILKKLTRAVPGTAAAAAQARIAQQYLKQAEDDE